MKVACCLPRVCLHMGIYGTPPGFLLGACRAQTPDSEVTEPVSSNLGVFQYATQLISTTMRPNISPLCDPTYFHDATQHIATIRANVFPLCDPTYFDDAAQPISTRRPNISPLYDPTEAIGTLHANHVQSIQPKQ